MGTEKAATMTPGTCLECAELAVDKGLWRSGLEWVKSSEDGLCHWALRGQARTCGELRGVEYEVTCGRNFVCVTRDSAK